MSKERYLEQEMKNDFINSCYSNADLLADFATIDKIDNIRIEDEILNKKLKKKWCKNEQ